MTLSLGGEELDLCDRSATHHITGYQLCDMSELIFIRSFSKQDNFTSLELPDDDTSHNSQFSTIFEKI